MNKKNPVKTVSILLSIVLVLCTFTSIVGYAKVTKSDDYIHVMIDHTPRFPVIGEEVTFFVHLTGVDGSEVNCTFYEDGLSNNANKSLDYNVEGTEIRFTLNWDYNELGEKHPRFVVTDNSGGEGNNGERICVAELYDKQINIDPIEQEPRVPVLFSTDELTYDGCRWIFDDSEISYAIVNDNYWSHPIELGISGLVEEREYKGRFVEVEHAENGDNYYVTKFSYEIKNLISGVQGDFNEAISNLVTDKDLEDNFNSEGRSYIALYNEITNVNLNDNNLLHSLFDDFYGHNLADKIDELIDPNIEDNEKQTYLDIRDILKDAKSDVDSSKISQVLNYLRDNEIKDIDDIKFEGPITKPAWAKTEEEVRVKIKEVKDELLDHLETNNEFEQIYAFLAEGLGSDGLEVDILTLIIWFATIFLLCMVITATVPEVALVISAIDGILISVLFLLLVDSAGFIDRINSFIKSRDVVIAYGFNEFEYSALISVFAIIIITLPILAIFCTNSLLSSVIASTTVTALAASAYVLVPMIKEKLNFDDDSSSPAPVPVPIQERPLLSMLLSWFFDRNPDKFPLLRLIFGY